MGEVARIMGEDLADSVLDRWRAEKVSLMDLEEIKKECQLRPLEVAKEIAHILTKELEAYAEKHDLCPRCYGNLVDGDWDSGTFLDPPEPHWHGCEDCGREA